MLWNRSRPTLCHQPTPEPFQAGCLSVHEEDLLRDIADSIHPAKHLLPIHVGGKTADASDFRFDAYQSALDRDPFFAIQQASAPRSLGLVSDEQNEVSCIRQPVLQMVQDSSTGRHAARRNDDRRTLKAIQPLAFRD